MGKDTLVVSSDGIYFRNGKVELQTRIIVVITAGISAIWRSDAHWNEEKLVENADHFALNERSPSWTKPKQSSRIQRH